MNPGSPDAVSADKTAALDRARALVPVLAERAARTERERRVPDETIADFHRSGLFRVLQPKRFGGFELDFSVFAGITRELARGCGSSAWVYCVVEELFWVLATFPEEAQTEIWGEDPAVLACAALMPTGTGVRDGDGYRVSGNWGFLSGSDHAAWVFLTATCDDGKGGHEIRNFFVRRAEVQFIDDWHVFGLVGTGSKSCKADGVYVPPHRSVRYNDLLAGTAPGARVHPQYPLCRAPRRFLTTFSITPVIVGLANRAIEIATDMLKTRLQAGAIPSEFEVVQQKLAESAAEVATANMILDTHLRDSVAAVEAGQPIGEPELARNRLMSSYMVRLSKQAIERLVTLSGSHWVYNGHPMQAILRDALAGASHRAFNWEINARSYSQSLGIAKSGAPPIWP
jgi:3-hydroxy-9,10-secoandrosta-1,3,5(10)-triene-9,17-dione monooxygenase